MKPEVSDLLSGLMDNCTVALITGRSIGDVEKLLPRQPHIVIGNHGSEGILDPDELSRMRLNCTSWLKTIAEFTPMLKELGVGIENKDYSLTFHYRNSRSPHIARVAIEQIASGLPQSRVTGGKYVVNVVPENSIHKGKALELLMQKNNYRFAIYFGDDLTDEDVFRVRNPRLLTVKVGNEPSLAKYFVNNQSEIENVLRLLNSFFSKVS
jgi:trehalose 6-phosphate phosphatase